MRPALPAAILRPHRSRLSLLALLVCALLALQVSVGSPEATAATARERALVRLINKARHRKGRDPLKIQPKLVRLARRHTRKMVRKGELFHNRRLSSDLNALGLSWSTAGENVGRATSVKTLHRAFMDSVLHRRNNLNGAFKKVGVGIVVASGIFWATVVFVG